MNLETIIIIIISVLAIHFSPNPWKPKKKIDTSCKKLKPNFIQIMIGIIALVLVILIEGKIIKINLSNNLDLILVLFGTLFISYVIWMGVPG